MHACMNPHTHTHTHTHTHNVRGWVRKFCHRCFSLKLLIDMVDCCIKATFLLYNDAKIMHERQKYFEMDALKDTWVKTTGTFS